MSTFLFWQAELLVLQAHLSKGPNNLKQNGTIEVTTFSCLAIRAHSHGGVHFVPIVGFEKP